MGGGGREGGRGVKNLLAFFLFLSCLMALGWLVGGIYIYSHPSP